MKVLYAIGVVALVIVFTAGGFYAGTVFAQSQSQNVLSNFQRLRAANPQTPEANDACGFSQGANADASGDRGQSVHQGGNMSDQFGHEGDQRGNAQSFGQCVARGQIKAVNGNTIQISTPVNVVTAKVGDKTLITKTVDGSLVDLKPGDRVVVFSPEQGASPTASVIQIQRGMSSR